MKKIYTLALLLIIGCASNPTENSPVEEIVIGNTENRSPIALESVFSDISYVKLDTASNYFIGGVSKIICKNDDIYISNGSSIYIFDISGKGKYIINNKGKADNEYLQITDINLIGDTIVVLDDKSRKLLYYSKDGKHLKSQTIKYFANTFGATERGEIVINNNYIFPNKGDMRKLTIIDNGKSTDTLAMSIYKSEYLNILGQKNFLNNNGELLFFEPMDNNIYIIKNGCAEVKYKISFGEKTVPIDFLEQQYNDIMVFLMAFNDSGYYSGVYDFWENNETILLKMRHKMNNLFCYYDKTTKTTKNIGNLTISDDILVDDIFFNEKDGALYLSSEKLIDDSSESLVCANLVSKYNLEQDYNGLIVIMKN